MRRKVNFGWVALSILFLMLVFPLSDILPQDDYSVTSVIPAEQTAEEAFGKLPVIFIENQGQLDGAVEYYIKTSAQTLYFTRDSIILDLRRNNQAETTEKVERQADRLVFSLDLINANSQPTIEGIGKDTAVVNYLKGKDPEKWRTDIPTYSEVVYHDIYPAIDLRLRSKGNALEYDFVVKPGATPGDIRLAYNGVNSLTIENSELIAGTAFGHMKQCRPYIYQQIVEEKVEVAGGFRLGTDNTYGFFVADYNDRYPLIIDPTLAYSTYLGGSTGEDMPLPAGPGQDSGRSIAVDAAGCAYVVGITSSSDFPTENPYQGTIAGGFDAFVAKLSAEGNSLIYSTYLGGSNWDNGMGIAVDAAGCAYITGDTLSSDFPTQDPYQDTNAGSYDAFVAKLSAAGDTLVYSTYLGGGNIDSGFGISVDVAGDAYVAGRTNSSDFPTENPYQGTYAGGPGGYWDAFVAKLSVAGDTLVYSTYLGGNGNDVGFGMAIDAAENVYVTGWTTSEDFPTESPYQAAMAGNSDAFITKLSAAGDSLMYSTFLGGGAPNFGADHGWAIAVDAAGCAYVTGITDSSSFPTVNPYQDTNAGDEDAFVTKLSAAGDSLIFSTYLGGSERDEGRGIAVDAAGGAYVTGDTSSSDFPAHNPYQGTYGGDGDAFVTRLSGAGNTLVYSTYFGGNDIDSGMGIAVDAAGGAYVTGSTYSTDFPTENPYQGTFAGGYGDAFVAKLLDSSTASVATATGTGVATFTTDNGSITELTAMATTGCGLVPPGISFPHGFFSFTITDITAGSTVTLTITFPLDLPADAQYFKCSSATGLIWLLPVVSIVGNVMTVQLTDGGIGDLDGVVNGTIVDPGGPAVPVHRLPWWIVLIVVVLLILIAIVILMRRLLRHA